MKRTWIGVAVYALASAVAPALAQDHPDHPGHSHEPVATPQTPTLAPTNGEQPKLVLSQPEWDFGTKWHGEACEAEVTIKNEGKAPLTIVRIRTSCGCTLAKPKNGGAWENRVIEPGGSEIMSLNYNTKKAAQKVNQAVTIETNDPQSPAYQFQVKGEVKALFTFDRGDRIAFPRIERDEVATQTITMTSNVGEPVKLKLKPFDDPKFSVELKEVEPGKVFTLSATTKPPLALNANNATVTLETGVAQSPELQIQVTAFVTPRVQVAPPKLMVSPKVTQPFQKNIRVTYKPDKPVKITNVTCTSDKVKCEVQPPAPIAGNIQTAYHDIKVTLPPGNELPAEGAKIEITTDDPSPEYQKLVVEIVVRDMTVKPPTPPAVKPGAPGPATPAGGGGTGSGTTEPTKPDAPKPTEPVKP